MADQRREELEARFFDGVATADEETALASVAAGSPEVRQAAARQLVLHRVLRRMGLAPLDPKPIMEAVRRNEPAFVDQVMRALPTTAPRPRRRTTVWVAGALAAAAGVALWVGRDRPAPPPRTPVIAAQTDPPAPARPSERGPSVPRAFARPERTSGTVRIFGASLVTVGASSSATTVRADGTRLELGGDAVLTGLDGDVALLARGPLLLTAAGPLTLATPHTRLETMVRGARLRLEVGPRSTRVEVDAGTARLWPSGGRGPVEVTVGRYALVLEGRDPQVAALARGGRALLVVGEEPLRLGDKAVKARLDLLGFDVRVILPGDTALETAALASRTVLVSSTVSSFDFTARLREAAVPVVTWERSLFDDLGMTAPCDQGSCGEVSGLHVLVRDPSHPLAAGLTGLIQPSGSGPLTWGTPGLHAAWVATASGQPDRAVVFGYDRGVEMPGLVAPARRVACSWATGRPGECARRDGVSSTPRWNGPSPANLDAFVTAARRRDICRRMSMQKTLSLLTVSPVAAWGRSEWATSPGFSQIPPQRLLARWEPPRPAWKPPRPRRPPPPARLWRGRVRSPASGG